MTSLKSDGRTDRVSNRSPLPPAARAFGVEVHRVDRTCRVALIGEMDLSNIALVDVNLATLAEQQPERLVLDLRQLTFMESSGLRLILYWAARAELADLDFCLVQGGRDIRRLFEITGTLDDMDFIAAETTETDRHGAVSVPVGTVGLTGDPS